MAMEKDDGKMATTIFDPDGDRKIVAGPGPKETFVVSSKAMSTACKPWSAMLGPESLFLEATKSFDGLIRFPDDNVNALRILLAAAHDVSNSIPATLEFEQLLQVAILCDKYDAAGLVQPWINGWMKHIREAPAFTEENAGWLLIAWTFGSAEIFRRVAMRMVLEMEVDGEGIYIVWGARMEEEHLPSDVLESISESRGLLLDKLLKTYYDRIDRFAAMSKECTVQDTERSEKCDALQYGSLLRGLQSLHLWPTRQAPLSITNSVSSLADRLLKMKGWRLEIGCIPPSHKRCTIIDRLAKPVSELLNDIPSPVTDSHIRHLEIQRAKCPLDLTIGEAVKKGDRTENCDRGLQGKGCGGSLLNCGSNDLSESIATQGVPGDVDISHITALLDRAGAI